MGRIKNYNARGIYFPDRIIRKMNEVFNYPLAVVEAPMGYGKTTAVRECLKNTGSYIKWQRIYDSSKQNFWSGFCSMIHEFNLESSEDLLQLGLPEDSDSLMEALNIINQIEFPKNSVMVLDDYHLLECDEINQFIEFLVRNEISDLSIVLIVRFIDFKNYEELVLKGYLIHIPKETFEFDRKEIMTYYKICGITLLEKEVEMLHSRTEGWISGLYLLMLNYKNEGSFNSTDNINRLMEKAIYSSLSEETKVLLLTMSIFNNFTLSQAVYLYGESEVGVNIRLTEIINNNAFVKYDTLTKTYQMHKVYTTFLLEEVDRRDMKEQLFQKATQWFLKVGDYKEAMHYFYLCKDFDQLLSSMEEEKLKYKDKYFENEKDIFIKYMEECPDNVKQKHHMALLMYALRMLSYNEAALFGKVCKEFVNNIHNDHTISEDLRNQYLGEFELILCFTKHNRITDMMQHVRNAHELLTDHSFLFDRHSRSTTFGSPSILYMFYRESGKLEEHVKDFFVSSPYFNMLTDGCAAGQHIIMEGEWYFYRGDLVNAEISMFKALQEAEINSQTQNVICAMFLQLRIQMIKGEGTSAFNMIQNMYQKLQNQRAFFLVHTIELCEGYAYALLNRIDQVPDWIQAGDYRSKHLMFPTVAMFNIIYGRVLLIKGESLKLLGLSDSFIKSASVYPNLLGQIYTYIYVAAANRQIFRESEALASLKRALDIALPDQVYMPFVVNCDYIYPILTEIREQGIYCEEIEVIGKLYQPYQKAVEEMKKQCIVKDNPTLTEREEEIALLAVEGLSNRQIGEKLFVTQNTVKTQLKRIFEKLNINSRIMLKQYFDSKY